MGSIPFEQFKEEAKNMLHKKGMVSDEEADQIFLQEIFCTNQAPVYCRQNQRDYDELLQDPDIFVMRHLIDSVRRLLNNEKYQDAIISMDGLMDHAKNSGITDQEISKIFPLYSHLVEETSNLRTELFGDESQEDIWGLIAKGDYKTALNQIAEEVILHKKDLESFESIIYAIQEHAPELIIGPENPLLH